MTTLLEQSRAYARLGMLDEAVALADECAGEIQGWDAVEAWRVRLAYKCGDFQRTAELGRTLLGHRPQASHVDEYTALALHHLGKSEEAASMILARGEPSFSPLQSYLAACFLIAFDDCDEAIRHLFQSLHGFREEPAKTWLDGDLKRLWQRFAVGRFTLPTAHILIEHEFDILREWKPDRGIIWELDPTNVAYLPVELRRVIRWDGEAEAHILDYAKAPAGSVLADSFEQWALGQTAANQRDFDTARRIAWERVLDAQPRYALVAWRRGDLCAVRNHIMWALENDPARIRDFLNLEELDPLTNEMALIVESDWDFFSKLEQSRQSAGSDPKTGLEIIEALPREWHFHPMVEHVRGLCLESLGHPIEGLPERLYCR